MKRAERRHHYARLKQARKSYHGGSQQAFACVYADTPCLCSCWMCGNPRRHYGQRSFQEIRQSRRFCDGV